MAFPKPFPILLRRFTNPLHVHVALKVSEKLSLEDLVNITIENLPMEKVESATI